MRIGFIQAARQNHARSQPRRSRDGSASVLNTYYRFEPSAWGNGYATEMASTAVVLARRLLPELPIIVRTRPGNLAAQAVAAKLGLTHAPHLDDHMLTYVSQWDGPDGYGVAAAGLD